MARERSSTDNPSVSSPQGNLSADWQGAVVLAGGLGALAGLYLLSQRNFLLFHTLAEVGAVAVAWSVFLLVWSARRLKAPPGFVMLGVGYLFVGGLDLLHTLAYEGMDVFGHEGADLATQLWISARYIEAATLLLFPLSVTHSKVARLGSATLAALTLLLLGAIFIWDRFPVCFDADTGLTTFKKSSEYVLMAAFAAAALLTWRRRAGVGKSVAPLLVASMLVTVVSEFAFTLYASPYGTANTAGHLLKVISFALIYLALVQSAVAQPYATMFRDLTQTNRRLSTLMGNLPGMAYRCLNTESWPMLFVSEGSADLTGYAPDALTTGDRIAYGDLIHPDDRSEVWRAVQESLGSGRHFEIEYRICHRDGSLRWVWERGLLVGNDEAGRGVLEGFIGDITERKEAERHLQYQATISEQVSDAIIATDLDLRITTWNPAATRIYGWTEGEAIGKHVDELLGTQWFKQQREEARTALQKAGAWKGEVRQKSKDGRDLIIEASVSWIRDGDGNAVGGVTANRDMTERRKAEQLLARSEERYRHIVETAQEGIWMLDGVGRTTYVNGKMAEMLGYGVDEVIGRSFLDFMDPADVPQAEFYFQRRQQGIREQHDFRFLRSDGTPLWTLVSTNPWMDEAGELEGVLGMIVDITARKEAEDAMSASEKRYRSIVSALPDLLFRIDSDLRFTDVQAAMPEMLLAPIDEIIGHTAWDILPTDIAELTRRKVRATLETRQIQIYHYSLDMRGEIRECETRMAPCGDDEVLAIVRDITEQERTKRKLSEEHAVLQAVFRANQDMLVLKNTQGNYSQVNPAFCAFLGSSPENIIGKTDFELFPHDDAEMYVSGDAAVVATGEPEDAEWEVLGKDGRRWFQVLKSSVCDPKGDSIGILCAARDITHFRHIENMLMDASEREQRRLAEELHDGLCQDLKSLEIEAALLEDTVAESGNSAAEQAAQMGKRINEAVRKAYSIVRGMMPAGLDEEGFATTIRNLTDQAKTISRAGIEVVIEETLEPENGIQAFHLYRIAQEALGNALRHAQASRIEMHWTGERDRMLLAIKDDGIGFANCGRALCDGGMGLLVMRSRAQAIGARLDIRSAVGEGTEVRCVLRGTQRDDIPIADRESNNEDHKHSNR